ncbi:MAG: glycosyltransferase, partial [Paraglaciecola sp.]|nr:glycosyltransferase [Paraglaciecola sp.]
WLKPIARYQLFIQCLGSDVNVHQHFPKRRSMLAKAFKVADAVITVSKDLEEKVRAICPSANVKTVYNGVNFDRFSLSKVPAEPKSLIFIGNLIKTKGIFELLQAVKLLNDPDITLNIVGGGPELNALHDRATALGITNQLTFHGRLAHEKVSELLHQCKLLVLPSYSEGVPNVIMESLACGIPVVATCVGGIPEVITKKNGILLASHQPEEIVAGILQCLQAQWQPAEIRQSISQYTWQNNSLELNKILSKPLTE